MSGNASDDGGPPGGQRDGDAGEWLEDSETREQSAATGAAGLTPDAGSPSDRSLLEAIRDAAGLDDLCLAGTPQADPYGRRVLAHASIDDRHRPVHLRVFGRPEPPHDGFSTALVEQLERWRQHGSCPGTVGVQATGASPRPWCCTGPIATRVADLGQPAISRVIHDSRVLARTLGALHDRGLVHAGIEPRTVGYDRGERPRLDAIGLVDIYRRHEDPSTVLDPRYAAPELHEPDRGIVDRTTDVYQLGAVLFRLLTGVAPYDGTPTSIREAVLGDEPIMAPSTVRPAVPEPLDRIVERATKPDPFERYESGTAVARALGDVQDPARPDQ